MSIEVKDHPEDSRYVIERDGAEVGHLRYDMRGERMAMNHAEIDPSQEGNGLGGRLVGFALSDARDRDLEVLPYCPFVRHYIQGHPEFRRVVPEMVRDRFGLADEQE